MTRPADKTLLPTSLRQNPSPVERDSQDRKAKVRAQVDRVMEVFLQLLPSNYVSQVQGPFYTMQFQAAAEQIAELQISAQETFADASYDYLRPEFMYQVLGSLVFPDARTDGWPTIAGDISYREFLKRMVVLLLQGATKKTIEEGLKLLSDADFEVIERGISQRELGVKSGWTIEDQFTFEVNVSRVVNNLYTFPVDPFVLQENVRIVMRALKPAHTLYDYRHLFRESFGTLFSESLSFKWSNYYYEDFRRYWYGAKALVGTQGITWTDRSLFSDPNRDFTSISPGADLTILSGPNSIHAGGAEGTSASTDARHVGRFRVKEILVFPVGTDTTARPYTTSPSGLTGSATVSGEDITDPDQDWSDAVEGEILTFASGPNAGSYRLKTVLGANGGPVGEASGPSTRVRPAPSLLRLETRMRQAVSGQSYQVTVDRLGVQVPRTIEGEDVSAFFVQ